MRADLLLQFIVPLTFLAIWALTSLLNRDAQPLPPRPGRAPGTGGGPRSGMGASVAGRGDSAGPSRTLGTSRPTMPAERPASTRWSAPPAQARTLGTGRAGGSDEGIVILESENRPALASTSPFSPSSAATARSSRAAAGQRASPRGRTPQAAPPKSIEAERPRLLTGLVSQPLGPKKGHALEIVPLSTPMSPLTLVSQQSIPNLPHATNNKPIPTLTSSDLRRCSRPRPGSARSRCLASYCSHRCHFAPRVARVERRICPGISVFR